MQKRLPPTDVNCNGIGYCRDAGDRKGIQERSRLARALVYASESQVAPRDDDQAG